MERVSLRSLVLVEQVVLVDIMPGARGKIQGMSVQTLLDMAPAVVAGGAEMQRPTEGLLGLLVVQDLLPCSSSSIKCPHLSKFPFVSST